MKKIQLNNSSEFNFPLDVFYREECYGNIKSNSYPFKNGFFIDREDFFYGFSKEKITRMNNVRTASAISKLGNYHLPMAAGNFNPILSDYFHIRQLTKIHKK